MQIIVFINRYFTKDFQMFKKINDYFTKVEIILLCASFFTIICSFILFDRQNYLTLAASLLGAIALILCAKGNPIGQILILVFSTLYGIISFSNEYYGEVLTYAGMTAPMAVVSLISWLKNPYEKGKAEVKTAAVTKKDAVLLALLSPAVTLAFYFLLKYFGTANLLVSTVSVTTTFIAVYLTFRRSKYFTLAYAVNDIVLITLWSLAAIRDISYISVVICFVTFLANDIYGFISWRKMEKKQHACVSMT